MQAHLYSCTSKKKLSVILNRQVSPDDLQIITLSCSIVICFDLKVLQIDRVSNTLFGRLFGVCFKISEEKSPEEVVKGSIPLGTSVSTIKFSISAYLEKNS